MNATLATLANRFAPLHLPYFSAARRNAFALCLSSASVHACAPLDYFGRGPRCAHLSARFPGETTAENALRNARAWGASLAVCPRNLGLRSFCCTDRVHPCAGCPDTFSTDELTRSRHTGEYLCAGCRAEGEAADARDLELHGTGDCGGDVFNGRALYATGGAL